MYEDHEYIPYSFEPAEPEQNNFQVPAPPASQDDGKKPKKRPWPSPARCWAAWAAAR